MDLTQALEVKRVQHSENLLHPGEYVFVAKRQPIITVEKHPIGPLSFAKNRSHCFSGCTTDATSQSSSSVSGSSDRSTSIEWRWKSNQRQKTSNLRSGGQVCSSRNQPANCATKISSHSLRKTS